MSIIFHSNFVKKNMEILDNIFVNQKKDKIVANLQTVVTAGRQFNEYTRESLIYEKEFKNAINEIVAQEVPEFAEEIKKVTDAYSRAIGQESFYIRGKTRAIEDLNDIQERFTVVVRQNEKYREARHQLREATRLLQEAETRYEQEQSKGGSKIAKYSVAIQECKTNKKKAIENLKKEIQLFIEEKKKFNAFRARRMKQSYKCYGSSTKNSMDHISQSYELMKSAITEAQGKVEELIRGTNVETPAESQPAEEPLQEESKEPIQEEAKEQQDENEN